MYVLRNDRNQTHNLQTKRVSHSTNELLYFVKIVKIGNFLQNEGIKIKLEETEKGS